MDSDFWSWFAGFWEGEGSISWHGQTPNAVLIKVAQKNRDPLDYIKGQLGFGGVTSSGPRSSCWCCAGRPATIYVMEHILPYLRFRQKTILEKLSRVKEGLKNSPCRRFSDDEDKFIKKKSRTMTDTEMGTILNRNRWSILHRRKILKIVKGYGWKKS